MLLFEFLIFNSQPLVFHVEALHLRLQLGQSLLQHGRIVRVKVRIYLARLLCQSRIRKHVVGTRRLLLLLLVVVRELEMTIRITACVIRVVLVYIS